MIVADASTIIEVLLRTRLAEKCRDRLLNSGEALCAPYLLDIEVVQVLRRYTIHSDISQDRGRLALDDFRDMPVIRYPHEPFLPRVWELRKSVSAYDAVYIALAEVLDAPLVTCDGRLARAHGHRAVVEVIA